MSLLSKHQTKQNDRQTLQNKFFTLDELLLGNDEQFVSTAYQALLGRRVDIGGLNTYTSLLLDGKSRVELLVELRRSGEGKAHAADVAGLNAATSLVDLLALQDAAFLSCAFQTLLCRPVDADAFIGYGGQLRKGMARLDILEEIRNSDECKSKDAFVREIERIACNHESAQNSKPREDVDVHMDIASVNIPAVPASTDQLMSLAGAQFIHGLHQILLARTADDEELESYVNRMCSGASRSDVMRAITQSEERNSRRTMLRQLDFAIKNFQSQQQPLFGRAARSRCEKLDQLVTTRKLQMVEYQVTTMNHQFKRQLTMIEKLLDTESAETLTAQSGKKRVVKIDQLSPFARDIYFQIKAGLEEREEDDV
jgi:Domain of unknown function (DUF4214)